MNGPLGIFVDANDVLYVADTSNHRILKISPNANGTFNETVIAGMTGVSNISSSTLNNPSAIYVDSQQNLYIVDTSHYRVQFWLHGASNGSTVAGSATGAFGSALNMLSASYALYVDTANNVYVSDGGNGRVVMWASGALTGVLVAGNGSSGYSSAQLAYPIGLTVDSKSSTLYIADYYSNTIVTWPSGMATGNHCRRFKLYGG